jgi:nucleoside-diphosphate-sugar epimerase
MELSKYNCGAEEYGTMNELLSDLCAYSQSGSKVRSIPLWLSVLGMRLASLLRISPLGSYHALMYGRSMYFDINKAKSELDWSSE